MKKVLLTAVALTALSTVASAKGFTGNYAGAKATYMFASKAKYSDADETESVALKNWEADILGGQYFQAGDWIWAVEGNLGRGITESKKSKIFTNGADTISMTMKTSRGWKVGVAGRIGQTVCNDSVLLYGRLGLQGSQFKTKIGAVKTNPTASTSSSTSLNFFSWAATPGVGVEYAFTDNLNGRLEYTYEVGLNKKSKNISGDKITAKAPQISTVAVGLTYSF
jgi:opacity protein-like surface antigen